MPLVYLPDVEALFLWGSDPTPRALPALKEAGEAQTTTLLTPEGLRETGGLVLPLFDTLAPLATVPAAAVVGEAMVALVLANALLEKLGGDHIAEMDDAWARLHARVARRFEAAPERA